MIEDLDDLEMWDEEETSRPIRPRRKAKQERILAELTDTGDLSEAFQTTYKPSPHEATWLLSSLHTFYQQNLIQDVLGQVKGGKEASVYRCEAHPATGLHLVAAKVYRPQKFRNLRNDAMYREGRAILKDDGSVVKRTDHRIMRALSKKTDFGEQVRHTSWLMHEFTTLQRLHTAGAAVPLPIAAGDNAILMGYQGDINRAAPTLHEVALDPDEAEPLFQDVLRNIELMLAHGLIHGDLSAYNILYWEGAITLIDFPQVTDCQGNRNAYFILQRDLTRVCDYFIRQGVACDPACLMADLWQRHGRVEEEDEPGIG